jgi:hypothetical protein
MLPKCLSLTATATTSSPMTTPTLTDLRSQYRAKIAEYDALLASSLAANDVSKLPAIRALNTEISQILERILTEVSQGSADARSFKEDRGELVTTLNRIQRDYNGLVENTDSLELLRRIREGNTSAPRREFEMYLVAFLLACLGILAMVFFGGQKIDATSMSATTPPNMAPLV